jgi:hypothetical protein
MNMDYGRKEFIVAAPVAERLVGDDHFRTWLLKQTKFAPFAKEARLLHEEMAAKRSKVAKTWWRSHFTESCRCSGCSGQETDLLAVFENAAGERFALHFEVKNNEDDFHSERQAASYRVRAQCWIVKPPNKVLPHKDAATVLLCARKNLKKHGTHKDYFDTVITFEDIAEINEQTS